MIKLRKYGVMLFYILFLSIFLAGCGVQKETIQKNTPFPTVETTTSQYSYASYLELDEKTLENLLTTKESNKEYKLIPATDSKEHAEYWASLVTKDEDYIKTFFLNREALTNDKATTQFSDTMRVMWRADKMLPDALFFIVLLNDEYAGIIKCADLTDDETVTVSYITAKEYIGQGVATNALKMFLGLIRHLNKTGFYDVQTASLWIFDDNLASVAVAKKNGFIYDESDIENKRAKYSLKL